MNKDSAEYKRTRELVARWLCEYNGDVWCLDVEGWAERYLKDADQIFSIKGIAIEADDQTTPCDLIHENIGKQITQDYLNGREEMVKANFRRII